MEKEYYYFHSAKMNDFLLKDITQSYSLNYAILENGEEVLYSSCSRSMNHNLGWDDVVFLGKGRYSRSVVIRRARNYD